MFWVHAGSSARFEQSYPDIADHVKIPRRKDPKANIKLVCDWLHDRRDGQWLLVLDNVDVLRLLPEAGSVGQGTRGTSLDKRDLRPRSSVPLSEPEWERFHHDSEQRRGI